MKTNGYSVIVIGLLLIFFNFTLRISDVYIINLIPSFIGYMLIKQGLKRLSTLHNPVIFEIAQRFASILVVYSVTIFLLDLTGLSVYLTTSMMILSLVLSLLFLILQLMFMFHLTRAIQHSNPEGDIINRKLYITFQAIVVLDVLSIIFIATPLLGFVIIIGGFAAKIIYMLTVNTIGSMSSQ